MMVTWKMLLLLTVLCLIVQAFFSMIEMACVSFNKVRLEYFVSKGKKRAIWLSRLIARPSLLFGASMLGVNTAMLLGSECARRLYNSFGLSPDWAALSQTILVVIFAEIAPMFAGRRFAEHAAMIGTPILYIFSLLARPLIWFFNALSSFVNRLMRAPRDMELFLSREELQKALEERDDTIAVGPEPREFDAVVTNIFSLKNKSAAELMQPIAGIPVVNSSCTVQEMRALLSSRQVAFLPIYNRNPNNIVAVAYPRDYLRAEDSLRIRELARPPWFIVQTTSILEILKQFRRNSEIMAIVLDIAGQAVGILTLDEIIDEIFGQTDNWLSLAGAPDLPSQVIVDRSFPGETTLKELKEDYNIEIHFQNATTLEELCEKMLGHAPAKGDTVRIDDYELTVEEAPLIGSFIISIQTIS